MSTSSALSETAGEFPSIHVLHVGERYPLGAPPYPELVEFNYSTAGYVLQMFFKAPRPFEIRAIRNEPVEFAVATVGRAIFLLYRFGTGSKGVPWSDSAFSYHLVPVERRAIPDERASKEERALMRIDLVDAETGILRGLRVVSLSPKVTKALEDAIRNQAQQPWCGEQQYREEVAAIYAKYSIQDLLERATARDLGGR
jgi:hypothetical protein